VISVVLIFGTINLAGIVFTAWVEDILSALKILPLIIIPIILIPFIRIENFTPFSPKGDLAFLGSAVVVYWCYTGFELSAIPSREAKEPEKTVPRSLFLVFLAVTLIYLGINLSIIGTAGAEGVASTSAPISYAMDIAFKGSGNIVQIIALISMLSALNAYLIGTSLIMQSIGSSFGLKISKDSSRGVPAYMIAICVILSCVLLFFANYFVFLASASVILSLIPYIGLCYAAFKLVDRPLVKIVSITGIISTAAVLISTFII
jgi:amino acid transporter